MRSFTIRDTTLSFNQDEESHSYNYDDFQHYKLFDEVMGFLGSIGFYVRTDKRVDKEYPILSKKHRQGRYADLEFKAEKYPKGFKIVFFQNVVFENPNGGEYDFDKRRKMPYMLGKQYDLTIIKLSQFLASKGIENQTECKYKKSVDRIKFDYVKSWHKPQQDMNFELSDLDGTTTEYQYNALDRDEKLIRNGDIKYFRDYHGYLARGKVYHNLNNMWWVIVNDFQLNNVASFELFDLTSDEIRGRKVKHNPPKSYTIRKEQLAKASIKELVIELKRRKIKICTAQVKNLHPM